MGRTYKTEGIIIKRWNFGEADKIITLFSKHYGKIASLAKGIRKLTSRKAGNLDLFNYTALLIVKGKQLDLITEAQVIKSFQKMKKDLKKVAIAYQVCELVDKLTAEKQSNYQVFNLLKESLEQLDREGLKENFLFIFKKRLLEILGFGLPSDPGEAALDNFIEEIVEKELSSKSLLKKIS